MTSRNPRRLLASLSFFATACCAGPAVGPARVAAAAQVGPPAGGEPAAAAIVSATSAPKLVLAADAAGLAVADLHAGSTATARAGRIVGVDATRGADGRNVLAAADEDGNRLRLFTLDDGALVERGARAIPLGFAVENLCLAHNAVDGSLHAFALGDGGEIAQWMIFAATDGKLDATPVRTISLPSGAKQCVADDGGNLYVAEEDVGIWRFRVNPEADLKPALVDARGLGHLGKKTVGLAYYADGGDNRWLLAANESDGSIGAYDLAADNAWLGALRVTAAGSDTPVAAPGSLHASAKAFGEAFPAGVLAVADEDGSGAFQLLSMADVAGALGRKATPVADAAVPPKRLPHVVASVETVPVDGLGDAADDPAIWANAEHPARSLVVATDKKGGMVVYDMQGKLLDYRPDGRMNNTDLRQDFVLGGEKIVLVAASDRSRKAIALYRLDTRTGKLHDVADGVQASGLDDPYGLCMYRSARDGTTYVFINSPEGSMRQWRLLDNGHGRVRTELVREFRLPSQAEGCVADDASGVLIVDEEDVGVWRMGAEPDAGDARTRIDLVADNPAIEDDMEGVGIYHLGDGRGYIVASSQGNDSYAVYRLEGDHAYLGSFTVVADPARGIDGISETDGLEVSSRNLGPGFEHGAMVAQDGRNVMPAERQNYKYVPWQSIARALHLEMR